MPAHLSNFSFLSDRWPKLAKLGQDAERLLFVDKESTVIKLRKLGESVVDQLYKRFGLQKIYRGTFDDHLKKAEFKKRVPDHILESLDGLRLSGNKGAHKSGGEDARACIRKAYNVCKWFVTQGHNEITIPEYREPSVFARPQFDELIEQHRAIVGREYFRSQIESFTKTHTHGVLVIQGAPGTGKTALLANAIANAPEGKPQPAYYFYSSSLGTTDPDQCVASFYDQLAAVYGQTAPPAMYLMFQPERLYGEFLDLLKNRVGPILAKTGQRQFLFVDALDEADNTHSGKSAWTRLPRDLPPNVFVIVSTRPGEDVDRFRSRNGASIFDLDSPDHAHAARSDVERFINQCRPGLSKDQLDRAVMQADGNFLVAKHPPISGSLEVGDSPMKLDDIYKDFWQRDVARIEGNARKHVSDLCGVLALSHARLSRCAIAGILALHTCDLDKALDPMRQFLNELEPTRLEGSEADIDCLLRIYHKTFGDFLRKQTAPDHTRLLGLMAEYFFEWKRLKGYDRMYAMQFGLSLLCNVKDWDRVESVLTDIEFLEARVEHGDIYQLSQDLAYAIAQLPVHRPLRNVLRVLLRAVRSDAGFLAHHPDALFQCLYNRCWWLDSPLAFDHYVNVEAGSKGPTAPVEQRPLHKLMDKWLAVKERTSGFSWVRSLFPTNLGEEELTMTGHTSTVCGVVFSPDDSRLASCDEHGTIMVWDTANGSSIGAFPLGNVKGHWGTWSTKLYVTQRELSPMSAHEPAMQLSSNSRYLVCINNGSSQYVTRLIDIDDGVEIARYTCSTEVEPLRPSLQGERALVRDCEGGVHLWSLGDRHTLREFSPADSEPVDARFLANGESFIVMGHKPGIIICESSSGQTLHELALGEPIYKMCQLYEQNLLVGATMDGHIGAWDITSGALVSDFQINGCIIDVLHAVDPDHIAILTYDSVIFVYDLNGTCLWHEVLPPEESNYDRTLFTPSGHHVLCYRNGPPDFNLSFKLYDLRSRRQIVSIEKNDDTKVLSEFAYSEHHIIATGSHLYIWNTTTGDCTQTATESRFGERLVISRDGRRIVIRRSGKDMNDHHLEVRDMYSGEILFCLRGHEQQIETTALDHGGRRVATGGADNTVRVWDAVSACWSRPFRRLYRRYSVGKDGKHLHMRDAEGGAYVFALDSGRCVLSRESDGLTRAERKQYGLNTNCSHDGRWSISTDKTDGEARINLNRSDGLVMPLAGLSVLREASWSPDSTKMAVAGEIENKEVIVICDLMEQREIARREFDDYQDYMQWSDDGELLFGYSVCDGLWAWQIGTMSAPKTLDDDTEVSIFQCCARDASTLWVSSDLGTTRQWDATTGDWSQELDGAYAVDALAYRRPFVAIGCLDETIIQRAGTEDIIGRWHEPTLPIWTSVDGRTVVAQSMPTGRLRVFRLEGESTSRQSATAYEPQRRLPPMYQGRISAG